MSSGFWDWYAAVGYNAIQTLLPYGALHHAVLAAAAPAPGERILVAGCGTGYFEWLAGNTYPELAVEAIDFSPGMLARARRRCAGLPLVRHTQADLTAPLAWPTAHFDIAVMVNVLYTLADPRATLREIARVVHPGGRLIFGNPVPQADFRAVWREHQRELRALPPAQRLPLQLRTLAAIPALLGVAAANLTIEQRQREANYHYYTAEELTALLAAAGFTITVLSPAYAGQCHLLHAIRNTVAEIHVSDPIPAGNCHPL